MENWVTFQGKALSGQGLKSLHQTVAANSNIRSGDRPQSARLAGQEADGFVTNEVNPELIESKLLPAFRDGARKAEILKF